MRFSLILSLFAPLGFCGFVGLFGLYPAGALAHLFLLPERGFGLQVINNELTGFKGFPAMRAGNSDKNDLVGRERHGESPSHP